MEPVKSTVKASYSKNLKLTILTGLLAAVSAALGFALIALPNVELITASIFLSGMLLGAWRGLVVGLIAEFIFSILNPMGMAFPPLLAAQLICMALAGLVGGLMVSTVSHRKAPWQTALLGFVGLLLTLNYDFWTTLSFPLSAGFSKKQIIATLQLGIPFAIQHLTINTLVFALLLKPAYFNLRKFVPALMLLLFFTSISPKISFAGEVIFETDSSQWDRTYYEDLGDIVAALPGCFNYDLGLLGQPLHPFYETGAPTVLLYGIPMNSAYTGWFDANILSPGYLDKIELHTGSIEGALSTEGIISCHPNKFQFDTPYSQVRYHDGYYGLGVADFILAQRLGKNYGVQIGGRICEFNGRLANSKLNSSQIRSTFHWHRPHNWNITFALLSNRHKAEITHSTDQRLLTRSDVFLMAENDTSKTKTVLHYYSSKDDFKFKPDPSESGIDLKLWNRFMRRKIQFEPALNLSWYKVASGAGFKENQAMAQASMAISYNIFSKLFAENATSVAWGRDVLSNASCGIKYQFHPDAKIALNLSASSVSPVPLFRAGILQASDIYLPGTPIWELPPSAEILPNPELKPKTISCGKVFGDFSLWKIFKFRSSLFYKHIVKPFQLDLSGDNTYIWFNGVSQNISGAESEISCKRWKGFGIKVSYTLQKQDDSGNFFPHSYGFCWMDYQNHAFEGNLLYTVEIHGRYIGEREGEIGGVFHRLGDDNVWGARATFHIGDFSFFWGNENIFARKYELVPGYRMNHREEVWGVNWVFWD